MYNGIEYNVIVKSNTEVLDKAMDDWKIKIMKRKMQRWLEELEELPCDTTKRLMYKGAMLSTWANLNDMLEKYSVPEEEEDKQP
jgi:hypothetical protein